MLNFPEPEWASHIVPRQEVAVALGVSDRTLSNWASRGFGPQPVAVGGAALYDRAQVEAFRSLAGGAR